MPSPFPQSILTDVLGSEELNSVLTCLVYQLPLNQRHSVLLKYPLNLRWKTYSDVQIGTMLRISSTWVRVLRKRAFVTLSEKVATLSLGEDTFGEFRPEKTLSS